MRFRVALDSGGELPEALLGREEFVLIPMTLMINGKTFVDDGSLDQEELVREIAADPECPRTACPSPGAYLDAFSCGAEHLYAITISGELSGSYQSAMTARNLYLEEHPDAQIHVFNSVSASVGEELAMMKIAELEEEGLPFEEIVAKTQQLIDEQTTYFVLDNLETLRKNGRLSGMKALAASILKIKPICYGTPSGSIDQLDQARGINKAIVKMVNIIAERTVNPETRILGISHCNCLERAEIVRDEILKRIKVRDVLLLKTGGVSTVYANDGGIIVVI